MPLVAIIGQFYRGIHEQVVRNNNGRHIKFFMIYLALVSPSMERG
jgi:hypothetical protein